MNSTKYLRKKWYELFTVSFRIEKQMEYFLTSEPSISLKLKHITIWQQNYRPLSFIDIDAKIINKMSANQIWQCEKHYDTMAKKEVYSRYKRLVQYLKINVIHHINKQKRKINNHINKCKNPFDKTKCPFITKTFSKLGINRNLIKLIKNAKKPTTSIILIMRNSKPSC